VRLAEPADLPLAWKLTGSLLGGRIASLEEVSRVYHQNRAVCFVARAEPGRGAEQEYRPGISGVLAILYLSQAGEAAVLRGEFTPGSIDPDWLVRTHDVPAAFYGWAIAAQGRQARKEIALLARRISHTVWPHLRQYSHAVTPTGERLLRMLGYSELRQGDLVEPTAERIFHRVPTGSVRSGAITEASGRPT
jgi:hypothetical protein